MFYLVLFFNLFFQTASKEAPVFFKEFQELKSKKQELRYIDKYKDNTNVNVKAYVVSLQMKQAEYAFFPWKKLQIFKTEKKKLESLIKTNPTNVHLRYVRLVIQEKLPGILNYKSSIKEDKRFLKQWLKKKDSLSYLKPFINKNIAL
ncbi:MAG: hypothetical protein ACPGU6_03460 [Tenacibaculum sp.]